MATQPYFPRKQADRIVWLNHYMNKIRLHGPALGLGEPEIADTLKDIRYYVWVVGTWNPAIQQKALEATEYVDNLGSGNGGAVIPLPAGVGFEGIPEARPPGVLSRLFNQVARAKRAKGYTDSIGQDLGIIGSPDTSTHSYPEVSIGVQMGAACQCAAIGFTKYGHDGVWIECRRNGGDWEYLAIWTQKPYIDERPLLDGATAETREYRLRWWDKGQANGEWSPVQRVVLGA
jgi:hypothetical protein